MKVLFLLLLTCSFAIQAEGLDLSKYKGKVVYVDFWASWCGPCRQSFPWMNKIHNKYQTEDLIVLGINVDAEKQEAADFLEEVPADFSIAYDPEGKLAEKQGVMGMPSSYLYDRNGKLLSSHIGFNPKAAVAIEAEIHKAIGKNTGAM